MDKPLATILKPTTVNDLEHGNFILMACTTENPYFVINPALRSRCLLLELKPISNEEMLLGLKK
ncbi:hypothetical protein [Spiroplasma endosymbiont of Acasis viretata]|uniref:hypothetical protein n=1 Tax=Spiroplasma endosymbiont of Acasis viretata TaxID=3066306 RepID=UPI00313DB584